MASVPASKNIAKRLRAFALLLPLCVACSDKLAEADTDSAAVNNWKRAGIPLSTPSFNAVVSARDFGAIPNDDLDDAAAINAALGSTPASLPTVVRLEAGNYQLRAPILLRSFRVLRGAGSSRTTLNPVTTSSGLRSPRAVNGEWHALLKGTENGANEFSIKDVSGFGVGDFFEIVQDNSKELMFTKPEWDQPWARHAVGQVFEILAVNGNSIRTATKLSIELDAALNPRMRRMQMTQWVGIEQLSIDGENAEADNQSATIDMQNVAYVWLDDIKSSWTDRQHFFGLALYKCEITNSHFEHSHNFGGGGRGYGVALMRRSSGCLVENNTFNNLRHSMIIGTGANSNVFGYNISTNPNWIHTGIPADISLHGHYAFSNLFEGNRIAKMHIADYWGPAGPGNIFNGNCVEVEGITVADSSHGQFFVNNVLIGVDGFIRVDDDPEIELVAYNNMNWNKQADQVSELQHRFVDETDISTQQSYYLQKELSIERLKDMQSTRLEDTQTACAPR